MEFTTVYKAILTAFNCSHRKLNIAAIFKITFCHFLTDICTQTYQDDTYVGVSITSVLSNLFSADLHIVIKTKGFR